MAGRFIDIWLDKVCISQCFIGRSLLVRNYFSFLILCLLNSIKFHDYGLIQFKEPLLPNILISSSYGIYSAEHGSVIIFAYTISILIFLNELNYFRKSVCIFQNQCHRNFRRSTRDLGMKAHQTLGTML